MNDLLNRKITLFLEPDNVACRLALVETAGVRDVSLGIGTQQVAALFRNDPPLEADLENAIDHIEEAVMPLAKYMAGKVLTAGNEVARDLIDKSTGAVDSLGASVDAVEGLFTQLASASRRGAWPRDFSLTPNQAAALIILREFMHHAGCTTINVATRD